MTTVLRPSSFQSSVTCWTHEPVRLRPENYEEVREKFVHRVFQFPGVVSIYEHRASPYEAGLSDIDLIVVCDPTKLPRGASGQVKLNLEDPHARDIFRGGPDIYPNWLFQESLLNPHWQLRLLYGKPVARRALIGEESEMAFLTNAMTRAGQVMISLASRRFMKSWPVKYTLGLLKGLIHNYSVLEPHEGEWPEEMKNLRDLIVRLRTEWFSLESSRYEDLEMLTLEGQRWAGETCWQFQNRLRDRQWLAPQSNQPQILVTPHRQILLFTDTQSEGLNLNDALAHRYPDWLVVNLPSCYYLYLASILHSTTGPFQHALKKIICPAISDEASNGFRGGFADFLKKRSELQQAHFEFLRFHRLPVWGCEGEWFIRLVPQKPPSEWWRRIRYNAGLSRKRFQMIKIGKKVRRELLKEAIPYGA